MVCTCFIKRRGNNPQKYIVKKDRKQTSTPEVPRKTETIERGDRKGWKTKGGVVMGHLILQID